MGAQLSKHPRMESVKIVIVVASLCYWLDKSVNELHNPSKTKTSPASSSTSTSTAGGASSSTTSMPRTPSVVNLLRSERLHRADELERSVPRSYRMAAESFGKCFLAIGLLDFVFARHSKAR
jgi:hypothetical protein